MVNIDKSKVITVIHIQKFRGEDDFTFLKEIISLSRFNSLYDHKDKTWKDISDSQIDEVFQQFLNVNELNNKIELSFNRKNKDLADDSISIKMEGNIIQIHSLIFELEDSKVKNLIEDSKVIKSKYLLDGTCSKYYDVGEDVEDGEVIKKIREEFGPYSIRKVKMDNEWWLIIPPAEYRESSFFNFSDEVLLNMPAFKTERLNSGSILIQIVENYNLEGVDHNYFNKFKDISNYLAAITDDHI